MWQKPTRTPCALWLSNTNPCKGIMLCMLTFEYELVEFKYECVPILQRLLDICQIQTNNSLDERKGLFVFCQWSVMKTLSNNGKMERISWTLFVLLLMSQLRDFIQNCCHYRWMMNSLSQNWNDKPHSSSWRGAPTALWRRQHGTDNLSPRIRGMTIDVTFNAFSMFLYSLLCCVQPQSGFIVIA